MFSEVKSEVKKARCRLEGEDCEVKTGQQGEAARLEDARGLEARARGC